MFLATLLVLYIHRSVLEYDAEGYTKMSFLFEWNDFFFVVYSKYDEIRVLKIVILQSCNDFC